MDWEWLRWDPIKADPWVLSWTEWSSVSYFKWIFSRRVGAISMETCCGCASCAESFVTDWVMDDIEPQIDHGQFGSRKERSTTHYLVKVVDFILKHLERFKSMSRITVTDFSKAFDCVDHNIAIPKLIEMRTRPAAIPWICDFFV